jgi:hypothetical protein
MMGDCRVLLSSFGCETRAIASVRQLNWLLAKLTGVWVDWRADQSHEFECVWPEVERHLLAIAPESRRVFMVGVTHNNPELRPFFDPPVDNVVSIAQWRAKRASIRMSARR